MNWINNYVRPKIDSLLNRRDMPENLWRKCSECSQMVFHRKLDETLHVCPHCDHHMAITPRERFKALFDGGLFTEIAVADPQADPLNFRDEKRYAERMREARKKTGEKAVMLVAHGAIGKVGVVCAGQNFAFMGGSMGMAVGDALLKAAETAVEQNAPLIVFSAAGGARMQEGILSLMQMPRSTVAVQIVQEAGLPFIVVMTHPTTGGVTASYAMLGDIHIAEPNALICFAGPRVIEQTIREKLPEGFQRSEYLLEHGMLDMVVHRKDMKAELTKLLRLILAMPPLAAGELPAPEEISGGDSDPAPQAAPEKTAKVSEKPESAKEVPAAAAKTANAKKA